MIFELYVEFDYKTDKIKYYLDSYGNIVDKAPNELVKYLGKDNISIMTIKFNIIMIHQFAVIYVFFLLDEFNFKN